MECWLQGCDVAPTQHGAQTTSKFTQSLTDPTKITPQYKYYPGILGRHENGLHIPFEDFSCVREVKIYADGSAKFTLHADIAVASAAAVQRSSKGPYRRAVMTL